MSSVEFLVKENIGLVYHLARRFNVNYQDRQDIVQAGLMGLLKAINRFDVNLGYAFSSFACKYILGSMIQEHRKLTRELLPSWLVRIKRFCDENSHMSVEELAQKQKTSKENILLALSSNTVALIDMEVVDELIEQKRESNIVLSDFDRKLVDLYFVRGLKQNEIAKIFSKHQSTISRDIKRISSIIRQEKTG